MMPRGAVGAVAADQPRRLDDLFASIAVTQDRAHRIARLCKPGQLHAALDFDPEAGQILAQ